MGIDIYAKWEGQTLAECEAQITGFSTTAGAAGYLREAYHGGPYVTNWLMPEAFAVGEEAEHAASFFSGGVSEFMGQVAQALGASIGPSDSLTATYIAERAGDGFPPEGYKIECEQLAYVHPKYPEETDLCAAILAAVEHSQAIGKEGLRMATWHTCESTHCRAGWAVHLAGARGYELEAEYGPAMAGTLLYLKAGATRVPNWYASDGAALADLRERAGVEA